MTTPGKFSSNTNRLGKENVIKRDMCASVVRSRRARRVMACVFFFWDISSRNLTSTRPPPNKDGLVTHTLCAVSLGVLGVTQTQPGCPLFLPLGRWLEA